MLTTALSLFVTLAGLPSPSLIASVQGGPPRYFQLDLDFDSGFHPNTDWGAVVVEYAGRPNVAYLNVNVNGRWEIQNVALFSVQGVGRPNRDTVYFSLGNQPGQPVQQIPVGAVITTDPQFSPPPIMGVEPVAKRNMTMRTGYPGGAIEYRPARGQFAGPGAPVAICHEDFPNQECGPNECAPAAVSNSLLWLKRRHNADIDEAVLALAALRAAFPFNQNTGTDLSWPTAKKNYLQQFLRFWEIDTDLKEADDINKLERWLLQGYDVEIDVSIPNREIGHCVAIVGVRKLADGRYEIKFVDDSEQGRPGGTEGVRTITVDETGLVVSGTPQIPTGSSIKRFVVEKVKRVTKSTPKKIG
jgi:hypothetical protein